MMERPKSQPSYLDWRSAAIIDLSATLKPQLQKNTSSDMEAVMHEAEQVRLRVEDLLSSDSVLTANVFTQETVPILMEVDSDWKPYNRFMLERVRAANELTKGEVRMQIVWWKTLQELGRFPMYPDPSDSMHIIDAQRFIEAWIQRQDKNGKVEGRGLCISFFSHRWERPSRDPAEAHPDSTDHKKAFALSMYGKFGFCSVFSPTHHFDYYFWIDFAGVNQYNLREKHLGMSVLCAFAAATVEIIMYNSSTASYEPRAWARLERMLGFTYCASPIFVYLDDNYPFEACDVDDLVKRNSDAFVKDVETGGLRLKLRDPRSDGAVLSCQEDAPWINVLTDTVKKVPIDTEHYQNDVKAAARQRKLTDSWSSSGRLRSQSFSP